MIKNLTLGVIFGLGLFFMGQKAQAAALEDVTLIVYYADWCGPCRNFKTTTDLLVKEGLCIERIDIMKFPNPKVNSIPRSFVHDKKTGKLLKEIRGFMTPDQLRELIRSL